MNAKRLDFKVEFCNTLLDLLLDLKNQGKNLVITGDYNIAHHLIDVYNPKNSQYMWVEALRQFYPRRIYQNYLIK